MIKRRNPRPRPAIDSLETRAVPSIDLAVAGPAINAAYSSFATGLRQAESTLATANATGNLPAVEAAAQAGAALVTLDLALATAMGSDPAAAALIGQELGTDGLEYQLATIYATAAQGSPDGTIPQASLAVVYTAVDAAVFASLEQTSVDAYLAAITPAAGTAGTGTGATTTTTTTTTTTATTVDAAVAALDVSLGSALGPVPTASGLIQASNAGGLQAGLDAILAAATAGTTAGSVSQADLPLLYAAVDEAIEASYQEASGAIYLDASEQAGGSAIDLTAIGAQVDAAYDAFATAVRADELALPTTTPSPPTQPTGPTGPTGPSSPTLGLSVAAGTAVVGTTGTSTLTFTVTLSAASTTAVTVDYATVDGTALAGTDYTAASGTLTFAPGVTTQTVDVTVDGETTTATDKTFTLNLTNATTATITSSSATGDITYATGTPALSATDAAATVGTTGTSTLAFTVNLSAVSASTVTVNYATSDATALAGTDYTAASDTLTFAPGVTSQTVDVTVAGESTTAATMTLTLNLSGAAGTSNAATTATGTITYESVGSSIDLSNDLADTSGGTEESTGTTLNAASFTTDASTYSLSSVTLLLAQATAGAAEVQVYSDGGLQPGTLLGTLTSPSTYSTTLASTTFTSSSGIALTPDTTYWVVLVATSGAYDWSWSADDIGTGTGFTDSWSQSTDGGVTWYTQVSSPTQMSVNGTVTA